MFFELFGTVKVFCEFIADEGLELVVFFVCEEEGEKERGENGKRGSTGDKGGAKDGACILAFGCRLITVSRLLSYTSLPS